MDCGREEYNDKATLLKCTRDEKPANIVLAVADREKYGGSNLCKLSRRYWARIYLSKLKSLTDLAQYNRNLKKWQFVEHDAVNFTRLGESIVNFSCDWSYIVTTRRCLLPYKLLNIYVFSPQSVIQKNEIHLRGCRQCDRLDVYFHPWNRLISAFVRTTEHFYLARLNSRRESSIFRVFTVFPDLSICLNMKSPAIIASRKECEDDSSRAKTYLRVNRNGFILNTGVSLIIILFSNTLPSKINGKKIWRVVRLDIPFRSMPSYISVGLGGELAVESCLLYANEKEKMAYHLVDCEEQIYCDQNWHCGLRHPLFVSRQEVCVQSIIDSIVTLFFRQTKEYQGACYHGNRDYEVDFHHDDVRGVCRIIILCICEVQIRLKDSEVTRNVLYLCRIETYWNIFSGLVYDGKCQILEEVPHEIASNRRLSYQSSRFSFEQDIHLPDFIVRREVKLGGRTEWSLRFSSGSVDLVYSCGHI